MSRPELLNSEGEETVFHEESFPLVEGATAEAIAARVDTVEEFEAEGSQRWTWTGPASQGPFLPAEGLRWNINTQSGKVVLGSVALKARTLAQSVNSAAGAERGRTFL